MKNSRNRIGRVVEWQICKQNCRLAGRQINRQPASAMRAYVGLHISILIGRVCVTTTRCCLDLKAICVKQGVERESEHQQDNQQTQAKAGLTGPVGTRQMKPKQIYHYPAE